MKINVVYSTDENYARHCGVSIYSLFDNNKNVDEIDVYIISNDLSKETKENFFMISKEFNRKIFFVEIDNIYEEFTKNNDFPKSAYARLFTENISDKIDKILYLDCDTVIVNDISGLWNTDIDEYYFAGVQDPIQRFNVELVGLSKEYRYINSGVLLINLKKWREDNLKNKFVECMERFNGKVPHHDQGVLNIVCKDRIKYLSPKYNLMPELICMNSKQLKRIYKMKNFYTDEEILEANKNKVIIHYITKWYNRPWYGSCTHPYKNFYIEYLSKTNFNKDLLSGKLKSRIIFQKYLFENFPFFVYLAFERLFDFRRKIIVMLNIKKEKSK